MNFYLPSAAYARRDGVRSPRKGAKRKSPERALQVALVKQLTRHAKCLWWAVPNGGFRHLYTATKMRAEGVRRGVPDLCFVLSGGTAAFLEMKAPGGSLSPEQKQFRDRAVEAGALWASAKSIDDAWDVLAGWGVLPGRAE